MQKRYFTPYDSVNAWIKSETPSLSFTGTTFDDYNLWIKSFKPKLLEFLGRSPEKVPLNPEIVETVDMDTYIREKVIINTAKYDSVPMYVLIPKNKSNQRLPAILAAHGHGEGKIEICGIVPNKRIKKHIAECNYDYAVQFVKRGYFVIAPDWRGFGERSSPKNWVRNGRDPCNVNYMAYGYLGYQLLNLQIWDGMRVIDYLQTRPEVDPTRIGCAGLSFGGTMTTYLSALDDRIKVACISGYLSTIEDAMGMRGIGNFCGSQYMAGLKTIGNIAEVAGLIATKPLLIEMGKKDTCFVIEDCKKAYAHLQKIYTAANAVDKLDCDIHPGPHAWSGAKAYDWFAKWI